MTTTRIETPKRNYPAAEVIAFPSGFDGYVHVAIRSKGRECVTDLKPGQARLLAEGLIAAADEAEQPA